MPDPERKIPYNYTSADDRQVITHLFGSGIGKTLEKIDLKKNFGRSSRLFYRLLGDLFVIERNPFLFRELVDNPRLRKQLFSSFSADLADIRNTPKQSKDVQELLTACQNRFSELSGRIDGFYAQINRITSLLSPVLGKKNIYFDAFNITAHSTDATDWRRYVPLAVLRPDHESQVPRIIKKVKGLGYKLIPRGGGTGLTGGATPLATGCIMLNTEKLSTISPIRTDITKDGDRFAALTVGAGVITQEAIDFADKNGYIFATDPTSAWACTIGGNLAENAGGKKAVLFGTAIDNVLSYNITMPDGQPYTVNRKSHPLHKIRPGDCVEFDIYQTGGTRVETVSLTDEQIRKKGLGKDVTHKALSGLFGIQKEGCDGIITSATFILYPKFQHTRTVCIEFFGNDMAQAGRVIQDITKAFPGPSPALMALEHFDEEYIKAIRYKTKTSIGSRIIAVLLVDLVSDDPQKIQKGLDLLENLLASYDKTGLSIAKDKAQADHFWQDRKRLGAIAAHTNAFKLNEDIVLPIDSLAGFASWVDQYNIREKKINQENIIRDMVACLDTTVPLSDPQLFKKRAGQAKDLAYRIRKKLEIASRDALEAYIHVKQFYREVMDSLRGFSFVRQQVEEVYNQTRSRLIVIATHMHAGDGNVHVNIPVLSNDRLMMQRAHIAADRVMKKAVELEGVVSGEHGVGITKIKHLEPEKIKALDRYRAKIDPDGLMNPKKLSDPDIMDHVFTPSFNLLELEARILKHGSLSELALKVAGCVRCGKCKVTCPVFFPPQNMFFHPRNKNLAIGSLIEALLYLTQRTHNMEFKILKHLGSVADHCTICHKCFDQCPVSIDSGDISISQRKVLDGFGLKKSSPATRTVLSYLRTKGRYSNPVYKTLLLETGTRIQRLATALASPFKHFKAFKDNKALQLFKTPAAVPHHGTLSSLLTYTHRNQAVLIEPDEAAATVFYFPGCGSEKVFTDISFASLYLLLANHNRVILPPSFLCCGFPFLVNAKNKIYDKMMLENMILFSQIRSMFEDFNFSAVIVSCGTCMESLNTLGVEQIFEGPLTDISEYVLSGESEIHLDQEYLYHAPCHDSLKGKAVDILEPCFKSGSVEAVPYCCSESGTMALSRPDISNAMLERKKTALKRHDCGQAEKILTNCPSCISGLSRISFFRPVHLAQELALKKAGPGWKKELNRLTGRFEVVSF